MAGVPVQPDVLQWAAVRSGRGMSDFEHRFAAWRDWLEGDKQPTMRQVEDVAKFTHVPFGVFFLQEPPEVELPIADFRIGAKGQRATPSQELLDVILTSQVRQAWYRDYALANGRESTDISPLVSESDVIAAALSVATDLQFSVDHRRRMSREDARNHLRHAFERLGGIVVFTSMVGNDNHRGLSRDEFRGFTLADPIAPLIFVNTADDTLSGQVFTFIHEYVHAASGQSGVGDEDPVKGEAQAGLESWCNAVAAEVLVPKADLRHEFRHDEPLRGELDRLAQRYIASTLTVLIKLRTTGLLPRSGFDALLEAERQHVNAALADRPARSGGDHYLNQPFRLGELYSRAVITETLRGNVTYTEAFQLLGFRSADQIDRYARKLGMR